jgi:hypothetical protein
MTMWCGGVSVHVRVDVGPMTWVGQRGLAVSDVVFPELCFQDLVLLWAKSHSHTNEPPASGVSKT